MTNFSYNKIVRIKIIYLYGYVKTMDTKLTLKLDQDIIDQAKTFAKGKNTSLSKLIENYLSLLVEQKGNSNVTPLVKSLSGIITLQENFDYKADYQKHLASKYNT